MRYFITPDGSYYEGENVAVSSVEVTQRPSAIHVWNNGWAIDPTLQAKQERDNNDGIEQLDGKNDAAIIAPTYMTALFCVFA